MPTARMPRLIYLEEGPFWILSDTHGVLFREAPMMRVTIAWPSSAGRPSEDEELGEAPSTSTAFLLKHWQHAA